MSDWTDNPFAQTQEDDNPFADPSVTNAQTSVPEYNPFDQPKSSDVNPVSKGLSAFSPAHEPATMQPSEPVEEQNDLPTWAKPKTQSAVQSDAPKPVQQAAVQQAEPTSHAVTAKQIETLRQLEYAERERRAKHQETVAQKGRPPNFPNFPSWMRKGCIQPCFHLDIKTEIPVIGQRITRIAYYSWVIYSFTLFWNWICCMALLSTHVSKTDVSAGVATAYLIFFMPCAYFCWFQQLYTGMRTDSSLKFGWFFLVMGIQFCASVFYTVGINGTGACGFVVAIAAISKETEVGILAMTAAGLWALNSLLQAYILRTVLKVYRSQGMSLEAMTQEAAVGIASNEAVQKAAVKGALSAASSN
eukprot:m.28870 g.28870  ORF g.28870 m.28870 type:complete len:359 (-) comp10483_c0_seq1:465-1541(-)